MGWDGMAWMDEMREEGGRCEKMGGAFAADLVV